MDKFLLRDNHYFDFDLLSLIEQMTLRHMSTVSAVLKSIERDCTLSPSMYDILLKADYACQSLANKINGLVEIFGRDGRGTAVKMLSYDVREFFGVLTEQMNDGLADKVNGHISYKVSSSVGISAVFDARRVCTIIYHLVANSIQHGGTDDKNVMINCRRSKEYLEISVSDHGKGIPEDDIAVLKGEEEIDFNIIRQQLGVFPPIIYGIGFVICRKLVSDMNGSISVKNYNYGAKVTIRIPQDVNYLHEVVLFVPDNVLFKTCMKPILTLNEGRPENDNNI